ncbi:MAG: response regulator transcription factor [Kiritimatiellae bacterium]|jgi:NarL family two-component system response regulator LiaR|nr:response regulator transcription factor [Kiritimatiellia bacterium]
MDKTRVLIVDDHSILRMGLASLIGTRKDIEVAGDADGGPAALKKFMQLKPDVVIMDLVMPGMDGIETTREIVSRQPDAKILILTTFGTSDKIAAALRAGALGAIMKNAAFPDLVKAIKTTARGERYIADEIERIMEDDPPVQELSQRQLQILEQMVRGLSNHDISVSLGISLDMVKEHATSLFAKIGAANRTEAVAIALRKQLVAT